jgi:hypothetical protein
MRYVADGSDPWTSMKNKGGHMLVFDNHGTREESLEHVLRGQRASLMDLAEREGPDGADVLWERVCRRWLMKGE